jgi:PAS domain S-box-containing protein
MSTTGDIGGNGMADAPQSRTALATLHHEGIKYLPCGLQNSLEALIANAPYAMALLDGNFRHLEVSDNYCRILGTDRFALLGRTHKELFAVLPQSWDMAKRRCLAGESVKLEGDSICDKDDKQFRINYQLEPWRKSRSKIGGAILFLKETAEDKREENQHVELLRVLEHASGFIALARPDGTLTFLNRAGRELIGLDKVDESKKWTVADFMRPSNQPHSVSVPPNHNWTGEIVLQNLKTGEAVPLLLQLLEILDDAGKISGLACIGIDLRTQIPDSQELQEAQRIETVFRLANGIAHDLNNMLLVINGYSSLLIDELKTDAHLGAEAASILNAGQRAARLAQQWLALSRF